VIPFGDADSLDDVFTFGRVVAVPYLDGESLSEYQVRSGHATRTKEVKP
jgi:endonuclease YncB( thermonuclease family)